MNIHYLNLNNYDMEGGSLQDISTVILCFLSHHLEEIVLLLIPEGCILMKERLAYLTHANMYITHQTKKYAQS